MVTRPERQCDCGWREYAEHLEARIEVLSADMELLKRHVFGGKKSEKMPSMSRELAEKPSREETAAKRAERALEKAKLVTETVEHKVPPQKRACPACGAGAKSAGTKESFEIEFVPGYLRRRKHVRETLACTCGEYIVTADAPERVFDRTQYGPNFVAHLIVQKCADSLPLYRLEKQFSRLGYPIARSTMTDLFHRAASLLQPLVKRMEERIRNSHLVLADETPFKVQSTNKKAYLWTFIAEPLVLYRFAMGRSGETPKAVLGDSQGTLVADAYSGYNIVTTPERRERAGCLAHARRKFFDAKGYAPEAQIALDIIRDIYIVERDAKNANVVGTDEHLAMRRSRSSPLMNQLGQWIARQQPHHLPKGPMGKAIAYAHENWHELTRFLTNPKIPPDNNRSERALRVATLGRKNFLFVCAKEHGENLAILYSLIATCEACDVEPTAYLADVLTRVSTHPNAKIDELLPDLWKSDQVV